MVVRCDQRQLEQGAARDDGPHRHARAGVLEPVPVRWLDPDRLQSLGLTHPKYEALTKHAGPAIALILILGYLAPPLGVAFNLIKL